MMIIFQCGDLFYGGKTGPLLGRQHTGSLNIFWENTAHPHPLVLLPALMVNSYFSLTQGQASTFLEDPR